MNKKVKVTALVDGTIGITDPDLRFRRDWNQKGATRLIDFDVLEELIYNPGVEYMFKEGILGIDDMEVKVALGLEPEGAVEPQNIIVFDDNMKKRLLAFMPFVEFKENVDKAPREQVFALVDYAIDNELVDMDKCNYLQEKTQIDILSAIQLRRQENEEVR